MEDQEAGREVISPSAKEMDTGEDSESEGWGFPGKKGAEGNNPVEMSIPLKITGDSFDSVGERDLM